MLKIFNIRDYTEILPLYYIVQFLMLDLQPNLKTGRVRKNYVQRILYNIMIQISLKRIFLPIAQAYVMVMIQSMEMQEMTE